MKNHAALMAEMRDRLQATCNIMSLEIIDDSEQHIGHAHEGAGHYTVHIISPDFEGKSLVKRHQIVYQALGHFVGNEIHALRIDAKTPDEVHS